MKIYTKTGDQGQTSLIGDTTTKDNIRIEAIGNIDELNCYIGVVVSCIGKKNTYYNSLIKIQNELFLVGADLANTTKENFYIEQKHINDLESNIDKICEKNITQGRFVLPGGTISASYIHLARAIARKSERSVVSVTKKYQINSYLIPYLNRLSDYLFVLARVINLDEGGDEIYFQK
jgi:cob(I)alamin adenosyltransferase